MLHITDGQITLCALPGRSWSLTKLTGHTNKHLEFLPESVYKSQCHYNDLVLGARMKIELDEMGKTCGHNYSSKCSLFYSFSLPMASPFTQGLPRPHLPAAALTYTFVFLCLGSLGRPFNELGQLFTPLWATLLHADSQGSVSVKCTPHCVTTLFQDSSVESRSSPGCSSK